MAEWYYAKDGEKRGPVTTPQLKQLAATGELQPDDKIWREGLDGWAKASEAKGLFGGSEPPSLSFRNSEETRTGKKYVWPVTAIVCVSILALGLYLGRGNSTS